jgi:hypothetical protein
VTSATGATATGATSAAETGGEAVDLASEALAFDSDAVAVVDSTIAPFEGWAPLWRLEMICYPSELKTLGKDKLKLTLESVRALPNGNKLYRVSLESRFFFECIMVVSAATGQRYPLVRREAPRITNLPASLPPVFESLCGRAPEKAAPPKPEESAAAKETVPSAKKGWSLFW